MGLSSGVRALLLLLFSMTSQAQNSWRFIVIADWHGAETFVLDPILDVKRPPKESGGEKKIEAFKLIKQRYGGELVVLPGDAESGKWYRPEFLDDLNVRTQEQAVRKAGERCYESMKKVFAEAGYSRLLMAVGDHEIGGNTWLKELEKTALVPNFRQIFYEKFNQNRRGQFLYQDPIGRASSRPIGTIFERTSFAYRHKNALIVTVDAFKSLPFDFHDLAQGKGGEGTVTCDVTGAHLDWFVYVLSEARNDPTIKHIFVQAHLPILQPVRKVKCSGQFMDGAENSGFFKAMQQYNVDVYFAGEVHANTATKDYNSNLVQVVSRGNGVENFITVDMTDDTIKINQYIGKGPGPYHNVDYDFYGQLVIDKSEEKTKIESEGSLKLLDRTRPMIYFSFDSMSTLRDRPVLGLSHDDYWETKVQRKITILGTVCRNSFANLGAYDQQYDAQVGDVVLRDGVFGKAAELNSTSRVAVFGRGPHSGGIKISYAMWFKTGRSRKNQILIHYGSAYFINDGRYVNHIFSLTLDRGVPALYAGKNMRLSPVGRVNLADDEWHHVAISMPRNSCRLSEVQMYVDGKRVATRVNGVDNYLFLDLAGLVSIGGFGHSRNRTYQSLLPAHEPYIGLVDELYVWADSLSSGQLAGLLGVSTSTESPTRSPTDLQMRSPTKAPTRSPTEPPTRIPTMSPTRSPVTVPTNDFTVHENYKCAGQNFQTSNLLPFDCEARCAESSSCLGYDSKLNRNDVYLCRIFLEKPTRGDFKEGRTCGIKN